MNFTLIDMDGWNLGVKDAFSETWLCFDSYEDARDIALWWDHWIAGDLDS